LIAFAKAAALILKGIARCPLILGNGKFVVTGGIGRSMFAVGCRIGGSVLEPPRDA
jgi:hypothetical protein